MEDWCHGGFVLGGSIGSIMETEIQWSFLNSSFFCIRSHMCELKALIISVSLVWGYVSLHASTKKNEISYHCLTYHFT